MEELHFIIENIDIYMLVFVRMIGIFFLNPVISRSNIPAMVRTAVVLCTSVLITPAIVIPPDFNPGTFDFILSFGKEIAVGVLMGYVFNVFYYMLLTAGDVLDTNFGFSMAKVFDPGTKIQSAAAGNLLNWLFIMYFFVTNGHLTLMSVAVSSFDVVPVGSETFALDQVSEFAVDLFGKAFGLALKLAIPFIATEFIMEVALGILMKLIPQITIFIIQYQVKIITAYLLLFVLAGPTAAFIDNYIIIIFDSMKSGLKVFTGG